ncbi:cobyric acid synthase [Salipaludibacillus sp. CF4.18]|uniref:cobyric acid synthase n=1 Tax=Salipaludibacillus sp. CF4.18 TaxID=3373081 RepID=UPI003EE54E6D
MGKSQPLMVQGTHSDAGKSIVVTALCRIFADKGFKTAPFKSQNMALNSYITLDGKEIGRAQGVQAEAARILASTNMNPILIKPTGESRSQIVVHGKPYQNMEADSYRTDFYEQGLMLIRESYQALTQEYDRIIIEGAGSPAEVNLNDRELVNMRVARMTNAPVVLVGDIDKGGVFASLVGTLQLLDPEDRKRVIGVIINKFRGDLSLLEPGLKWFEEYTSLPVLGVIPHVKDLNIEAEDSVVLDTYTALKDTTKDIDIAVIQYPRISNFTDIDPLFQEEDCHVRFVKKKEEIGQPDLIIMPGSKNTIEDLEFLRALGMADKIITLVETGKSSIIGICGGYQMLGEKIEDSFGIESATKETNGLGLIKGLHTQLLEEKVTILSEGNARYSNRELPVKGFEIHMGDSTYEDKYSLPFIQLADGRHDGFIQADQRCIGTYFHHIFHNDLLRIEILNDLRTRLGLPPIHDRKPFEAIKEKAFSDLAMVVEKSLDMALIEKKMKEFSDSERDN